MKQNQKQKKHKAYFSNTSEEHSKSRLILARSLIFRSNLDPLLINFVVNLLEVTNKSSPGMN